MQLSSLKSSVLHGQVFLSELPDMRRMELSKARTTRAGVGRRPKKHSTDRPSLQRIGVVACMSLSENQDRKGQDPNLTSQGVSVHLRSRQDAFDPNVTVALAKAASGLDKTKDSQLR